MEYSTAERLILSVARKGSRNVRSFGIFRQAQNLKGVYQEFQAIIINAILSMIVLDISFTKIKQIWLVKKELSTSELSLSLANDLVSVKVGLES